MGCQRGNSLVIVLFVTTMAMLLGCALLNMSTGEYLMGVYSGDYTAAIYLAEGGIQWALALLKENPGYRGESTWQELGEGQFRIKVLQEYGNDLIKIESTGRVTKAEVLVNATVEVRIEFDEEAGPGQASDDLIKVISWNFRGPI